MIGEVPAIYEAGMLRLLQPLELPDATRVTVTIATAEEGLSTRDWVAVERARTELAGRTDIPAIEEVRMLLSQVPGSWASDIVADRGEY
jgi:predicted DNA-binding antitoxin AbrB/MazE fold protein